jgi:hypothetical protein
LSIPSGGTATLPSDLTGVWTASAPAGPWTAPTTLDLQRATFDEGPNGFVGQLNKPTTLDLNGICYLFYSATTDGGQQGGGFHTKLAVANGTCAQMAVTKGGSIEPDRFSGQEWATINTAFAPQGPGLMIGSGISTTQTPAPDLFIQKVTNVAQTTHTAYYMMNAWAQTGVSPIQIRSTFGSGGFQFNSSATTTANGSLWWLLTPGGVNQNILYSFFDANGHAPLNIAAPYWLTANGSNNDITGELAFAAATTATYTWTGVYTSHPECTATPQFDLTATPPRVWITYSTTVSFTINTSAAVTGSFSYHCIGRN